MNLEPAREAPESDEATPEAATMPDRVQRRRRTPIPASEDEEITIPFDPESCLSPLVSQKEWAEAYSPANTPPRMPAPRLEGWRPLGQLEAVSGSGSGVASIASGLLLAAELFVIAWTAALLLLGFPMGRGPSWSLTGGWCTVLVLLGLIKQRRAAWRVLLWGGGISATLLWLLWSPWSADTIATLRGYFFLR